MTIIGLDYGTTFSTLSIVLPTESYIFEQAGSEFIPSLVAIDARGLVKFGFDVINLENSTTACFKDMKRWIGIDERSSQNRLDMLRPSYQISFGYDQYQTKMGPYNDSANKNYMLSLNFLVCAYIRAVILQFESNLEFKCTGIVLSVPANFSSQQRAYMFSLSRGIGVKILHIMNEPSAALFATVCSIKKELPEYDLYLVYDFGGGTFDVSVVERYGNMYTVILSSGDDALGGRDIDNAIVGYIYDKEGIHISSKQAAELKEKVSISKDHQSIMLSNERPVTLYYYELEQLSAPYVARASNVLYDTIVNARIQDKVNLVPIGGSVLLPNAIQSAVNRIASYYKETLMFPRFRTAVSEGCSLVSTTISSKGHVFVDCVTKTISSPQNYIKTKPIIPVGSPLPCTGRVNYSSDQQNIYYTVPVYEGDSNRVINNTLLVSVTIRRRDLDIPERVPLNCDLVVELDTTGCLKVYVESKVLTMKKIDFTPSQYIPTISSINYRPYTKQHEQVDNRALVDYCISQEGDKSSYQNIDTYNEYIHYLNSTTTASLNIKQPLVNGALYPSEDSSELFTKLISRPTFLPGFGYNKYLF